MPKPSRAKRPFIELRDASFRLGDRLLFENTSWTLNRNEQWAVIGPNGSGKSVFADALRGRLPLVHGDLNYHFPPPAGLAHEESIGHVAFEDRKSEVHGTVVQSRWLSFEEQASVPVSEFLSYDRVMDVNPFEVSARHGAARQSFQRRLQKAVRLLRLENFLSRRLLSLSNGERQRVQIARALAQPLRLLILDEPYVGLDSATREHFHQILEHLLKTNLRVLLVTARTDDLPSHVSHLLQLEDCRVVAVGPRKTMLPRGQSSSGRAAAQSRGAGRFKSSQPASRATGPKLVELRNVTVRYGSNTILNNLSWTVRKGESWALLGPNGSGKTTLLSLIQGDNPQAYVNEVHVFGNRRGDGDSVWELKQHIGWVSPELQLHFNDTISVRDAVLSGFHETIGLFERPTPGQIKAAKQWLRRFDLIQHAQLPLFSLSAGLQRMTLLARALVKNPQLLILDEPCQGLDPAHRDLIVNHVDALIRSGSVTAIFVTHRPEEIPPSIRRVLRLDKHKKYARPGRTSP